MSLTPPEPQENSFHWFPFLFSQCTWTHWCGASENVLTGRSEKRRQNFKQVPENQRLKSSITLGCFKCRHQKSYLMDWSWWSYNGFRQCQTDGCNGFLCRLAIGSLSVAPALHGVLHTFAGGSLYLLLGDHILNWLQKHSRKQEKETSATPVGRKILCLDIFCNYTYLAQMLLCRFSALLNIWIQYSTLQRKWPDLIIYSQFDTECSLSQQQITAGCYAL